jgi:hypothetical protein
MKRPFLERVAVVLWLLCGGVAAVTAFIGAMALHDILSRPITPHIRDQIFFWVVFILTPPLLFAAFISLFQYLALGFFNPVSLFRPRK